MIDSENIFEDTLPMLNDMGIGYEFVVLNETMEFDKIKEKIDNAEINSCIILTKSESSIGLEYLTSSVSMFDVAPDTVIDVFRGVYRELQIEKLELTEEQLANLNIEFEFALTETDENAASGNVMVVMLLSLVLFYAIYFCAYQVSSSITTEKTSRVMETLITSTKPRTIVLGKTIGIGLVGLIQLALIITVGLISAKVFVSEEILSSILDLSNITPKLAIFTFVYFILGYSIYSLLYALTGSTVSKPEDIQSANTPVAILSVVGFYLAYFSMMNPASDINVFASIFPLSAPFSMPFRIMLGTATTGEIIGSIAAIIVSIVIVAQVSIKIYSSAILNYGTKLGIKDILKMYKYKND